MQPSPPKTPYEERATDAFRMLADLRLQSAMLSRSLSFCFEKCLDTDELYTLFRTKNAPISYRLQRDMEEKKCIQNCSAKWDAILPQIVTEINERTIYEVQASTLSKLMAQQQQQQ